MKCIFSVDVEDWFHILDLPSTPDVSQWSVYPSRVADRCCDIEKKLKETIS